MKVTITTEVLAKHGLTFRDFGILLYYMDGGTDDIHPIITDKLWKKNFLVKELLGYSFNVHALEELDNWYSECVDNTTLNYESLAARLRELFPEGRKPGTNYYWRDNVITIAKKLQTLDIKFKAKLNEDEVYEATKKYVESFNGDYTYMQLLKYFILKKDLLKQEETSQLLSFIQNKDSDMLTRDSGELR